jgi:uncharacterized protein (DUF4213/DUF364 family)
MVNRKNILEETFYRLKALYEVHFEAEGTTPGKLLKVGLKQGWNVVIGTNGQCGMAMSFTGWDDSFGKPRLDMKKLQSFAGRSFFDVATEYLKSDSWQERSIGVAALTALSQPLLTPEAITKRGFEVFEENMDFASCLKPDDIAAVVGYGGGVKRLLGKCKELHVTDMRSRETFQTTLISGNGIEFVPKEVIVHPEKDNKEVLGRATAVSITGSALVNGTFEELLSYTKNARLVTVYGGSVGFIPDILFAHGVHMVHASRISDPAAFERGMINDMNMEAVMQGTQKQQTIRRKSG